MDNTKSPFYVVQEFLSPYLCEELLNLIDYNVPDLNKDGYALKTIRTHERAQAIIYERLFLLLPDLQNYYQLQYKGTEQMNFEWFPEESKGDFICENSEYLRHKWLRTRQRDLTGIIFLSDYQESLPFEQDYEVYGGKLEFVQHHFSFQPKRGTLIIFPSDPHFINITSKIIAGDLFQVRFHIAATQSYLYNPTVFPGDYSSWFKGMY